MAQGFGPADPVADCLEAPVAYPCRLWLDALTAECLATQEHQALLLGDTVDDVFGDRDAIGIAEDLDPPEPVWRTGVAEPAQAFAVATERRRVLQRIGEIEERRRRTSVVEVEQTDDHPISPDAVPRPEVAVADDLARSGPTGPAGPDAVLRGSVVGDRAVVATQEPRQSRNPASGTIFAHPLAPDSPSIHESTSSSRSTRTRRGAGKPTASRW